MRYVCKMTSDLTNRDVQDCLAVLNETYGYWGDEAYFRWKYFLNPYGDSLHVVGYDGDKPVASESLWRNDLGGMRAYQSCDTAVLPTHRRRGIFGESVSAGVERLDGEYFYGFPNDASLNGFLNNGWIVVRKTPVGFHLRPAVLSHYELWDPIPDEYVEWRFLNHPTKQYYIYQRGNRLYLLSKRRNNYYVIAGMISKDFGFRRASPLLLFSQDLSDLRFRIPRRACYVIENPCYVRNEGFIPCYRDDTL